MRHHAAVMYDNASVLEPKEDRPYLLAWEVPKSRAAMNRRNNRVFAVALTGFLVVTVANNVFAPSNISAVQIVGVFVACLGALVFGFGIAAYITSRRMRWQMARNPWVQYVARAAPIVVRGRTVAHAVAFRDELEGHDIVRIVPMRSLDAFESFDNGDQPVVSKVLASSHLSVWVCGSLDKPATVSPVEGERVYPVRRPRFPRSSALAHDALQL